MLDIKFIRENSEKVKKACVDKRIDLDIEELLTLDQKRRTFLAELESLRATKNQVSKEIPTLGEEDRKVKILEMKEVDSREKEVADQLRGIESSYNNMMLMVPNIPSAETPIGSDESENVPWSYWSPHTGRIDPTRDPGKVESAKPILNFAIRDHIQIGEALDLVDFEQGVKTSGFRGYYLKNEAVLLQRAVLSLAVDKLVAAGFTLMVPPVLVKEEALVGSGSFPTGRAEVYQVGNAANLEDETKEKMYLAGTSEPSLLAYYADKILDEKQLPILLGGITPCFRSEVGSYGKDSKGLYRVHEFLKVEQVVICKADIAESESWHEKLREIAESVLQDLQLSYRVLNICTGDMGAGKYKMYDIETWMPGRDSYGETHSDSNLTDWQSRRLGIRYKDKDGVIHYAYTLNNTAVASPRILIAILENYQKSDGSVEVPQALRKYVNFESIKPKV